MDSFLSDSHGEGSTLTLMRLVRRRIRIPHADGHNHGLVVLGLGSRQLDYANDPGILAGLDVAAREGLGVLDKVGVLAGAAGDEGVPGCLLAGAGEDERGDGGDVCFGGGAYLHIRCKR